MEKPVWPASVPVLTVRNFCRHTTTHGSQRCLWAWLREVFPNRFAQARARETVLEVINEKRRRCRLGTKRTPWATRAVVCTVMEFNDNARVSKSLMVDVWGTAMKKLGYTKTNPYGTELLLA